MTKFQEHLVDEWIDSVFSEVAFMVRWDRLTNNASYWQTALVALDTVAIKLSPLVGIIPLLVHLTSAWTIVIIGYVLLQCYRKEPYHFGLDIGNYKNAKTDYDNISQRLLFALENEHDDISYVMYEKMKIDCQYDVRGTVATKEDWRFKLMQQENYAAVKGYITGRLDMIGCECPDSLFEHFPKD